ncbi:SagB family peptide dehydrogenase [Oscillatoria salina]|uniref:SagB family peptide dehydrogenase n=1 Tax=Oscillatoria salina TaxID=331517 RepID=UPI0013BE2D31|nr:SagB family peptide dehydrogenase [Oscillatoria salina]MBZ8183176.1 SagB/ThcOx family dehydrogenase [Oscillatoria salina IIICB1]NET89119.1 SagB/ThcOx family dehydrogenase [Kamptonema sp. SIO1D9]
MSKNSLLSFLSGISLEQQNEVWVLYYQSSSYSTNTLSLPNCSPGILQAWQVLCGNGGTREQLSSLVQETDGFSKLPEFYYYLEQFERLGLICQTFCADGKPLAKVVPLVGRTIWEIQEVSPEQSYVLSRFAYLHRQQNQLVLESPLSKVQLVITDWRGGAILSELNQPCSYSQLCQKISGISANAVQQFLNLLDAVKMLSEVKIEGEIVEDKQDDLVQWEFHDLLFHSKVRTGRHRQPVGRTYRFLDKIPQLPAIKTQVTESSISLYRPDLEALKKNDLPFTWVLEERKSIRDYGNQPISDRQLGEFLYRSLRVRNILKTETEELSNRPYPSAGACYELEVYTIINCCDRIPSGLYHYNPQEHQLFLLSTLTSQVETLLLEAAQNNFQRQTPQVLIILAARFPRITWHYESIAYASILKNVGSVFQTMYLVATSLNLAPCAMGCGNADLFADVVGTDYYIESSVGEFALSSKP